MNENAIPLQVKHVDTTALTVPEWEAAKKQIEREGFVYAPLLAVFTKAPDEQDVPPLPIDINRTKTTQPQ